MWLAASFGFLMPAIRPVKTVPFGDDRTLQVRARRAKDLDILRAEYMKGKLGPTIHTPKFDYEYRAYCTPEAFGLAVARMITEIDYTKFKPTTDRYEDNELHSVYNSMWSVLLHGLSTKHHQYEYWNYHKDGQRYAAENEKKTTGTGYPKLVTTVEGTVLEGPVGYSAADLERRALDRWHEDAERRNPSATRDEYNPEIEGWDGDDTPLSSGRTDIDALYNEIDDILDGRKAIGPVEHTKCDHGDSSKARAACRARHRKAEEDRINELRQQIDEEYQKLADEFAEKERVGSSTSDKSEHKGFVWERKNNNT